MFDIFEETWFSTLFYISNSFDSQILKFSHLQPNLNIFLDVLCTSEGWNRSMNHNNNFWDLNQFNLLHFVLWTLLSRFSRPFRQLLYLFSWPFQPFLYFVSWPLNFLSWSFSPFRPFRPFLYFFSSAFQPILPLFYFFAKLFFPPIMIIFLSPLFHLILFSPLFLCVLNLNAKFLFIFEIFAFQVSHFFISGYLLPFIIFFNASFISFHFMLMLCALLIVEYSSKSFRLLISCSSFEINYILFNTNRVINVTLNQ